MKIRKAVKDDLLNYVSLRREDILEYSHIIKEDIKIDEEKLKKEFKDLIDSKENIVFIAEEGNELV